MVPASLFNQPDVAKEFFVQSPMKYVTGHVLGGVTNDVSSTSTAVHPGMREIAMEFLIPEESDPSDDGSMPTIRALFNKYVPPPSVGPVFNHDARNLNVLTPFCEANGIDNWQRLYWGSNLDRLQQIKYKYDPTAVFTCRDCVTVQFFVSAEITFSQSLTTSEVDTTKSTCDTELESWFQSLSLQFDVSLRSARRTSTTYALSGTAAISDPSAALSVDTTGLSTSMSSALTAALPGITNSVSSVTTSTYTSTSNDDDKYSVGEKAGIAIAAVGGVLVFAAAAGMLGKLLGK